MQSAMHLVKSAVLSGSTASSCTLQWTLGAEIKKGFNYCLQQH